MVYASSCTKFSIGLRKKTVEILASKTNAINYVILPTLKLFKISVKLDTTNSKNTKRKILKQKKPIPI